MKKKPAQPNTSEEKISLEISAEKLALDLQGKSTTAALLDTLSPFTQGMGWLGDKFSDLRRASAIRAAAKAKQMLAAEGITTGKVPPKILLPWLEGASLETDGQESLTDMWAGLLVRAVKSSDAVNVSYVETLKRIGKKEAELLHFFTTDTPPESSIVFFGGFPDGFSTEENPLLQEAINKLDNRLTNGEIDTVFEKFFLQGMGQIIHYSIDGSMRRPTRYYDQNEHAVANLQQLGLIEIKERKYRSTKHVFEFVWFEITKYAFDFFWACEGEKTGGSLEKIFKVKPIEKSAKL